MSPSTGFGMYQPFESGSEPSMLHFSLFLTLSMKQILAV